MTLVASPESDFMILTVFDERNALVSGTNSNI